MKAAYALGFLGLCAIVLVLHVYDAPAEETKEVQDPFLASLEAHVVAKAQRRLRARDKREASEAHISEARKAIKAALLDAQSSSLHEIKKAEEEQMAAQVKVVAKKVAKATKKGGAKQSTVDAALEQAANAPAAVESGKQFTWEELQRGDDAKKEIFTENKVGNLLGSLKAAPKADKSVGANAVVVGEGDAQVQEEAHNSDNKLTSALSDAKAAAAAASKPKNDDDFEDDEVFED